MRYLVLVAAAACGGGGGTAPPDGPRDAPPSTGVDLAISPAVATFGTVGVGTTSAPVQITLSNPGSTATTLALATSGPFVIGATTCVGALDGGASCTVDVACTPAAIGAVTGELTATGLTTTVSATLSAVAVVEDNILTISPAAHDFGAVGLALTATQVFTATNIGGSTKTPSATIAGSDPTDFAIGTDGCSGTTLVAGASCTVAVAFHPATVGAKTAVLELASIGGGAVQAALTGTGITDGGGGITVNPSALAYGTVTRASSADMSFTVTNNGAATTPPVTLMLLGANASEFAIGTDGCTGTALANLQSCTVHVIFTPTSSGAKQASVAAIASTTATVGLTGTGG